MLMQEYFDLFQKDLLIIESIIKEKTSSEEIPVLNESLKYFLKAKGKYIRPIMMLCLGGNSESKLLSACAGIEMIHMATLIHDDVIDESDNRRGQKSLNNIWGNKKAILIGDFLFSKAFELFVELKDFKILKIITMTSETLAKGELLQITSSNYLDVIKMKTGSLFEAAFQISSIISKTNIQGGVGELFGMAFQIADDYNDNLIDKKSDAIEILKNILSQVKNFDLLSKFITNFLSYVEK